MGKSVQGQLAGLTPIFTFSTLTKLILFRVIYYKLNRNYKSNNFQAHLAQELRE